jgi:hypothetical protein
MQLVVGIAWDLVWLSKHGTGSEEGTNWMICVLLLARHAMLYTQELRDQSQAAKTAEMEMEMKKLFVMPSCTKMRFAVTPVCPEFLNLTRIHASTAVSSFAPSHTMKGLFPPSSNDSFFEH